MPPVCRRGGGSYGASDDFKDYAVFDHPSPGWTTNRVDLTGVASTWLMFNHHWPFDLNEVPINGRVFVPEVVYDAIRYSSSRTACTRTQ